MEIQKITSRTGGHRIIASGIGITYSGESDWEIKIEFDSGESLAVQFVFSRKESVEQAQVRTTIKDDSSNIITVECINADDAIGTGTIEPVSLPCSLSMNFWIRTPDEGCNREIRYCVYEEVKNA